MTSIALDPNVEILLKKGRLAEELDSLVIEQIVVEDMIYALGGSLPSTFIECGDEGSAFKCRNLDLVR
jgi:hypothetical protein